MSTIGNFIYIYAPLFTRPRHNALQARWSSTSSHPIVSACQKIHTLMYPPSIPSHYLGSSPLTPSQGYFPDRELARTFRRRYENSEDSSTMRITLHHRTLLSDYFQVAEKMHRASLIPLVHGQAATWMIPQQVLIALGYRGVELLRTPNANTLEEPERIASMIDREMERRRSHWLPFYHRITLFKNLDLQAAFTNRLLSVTIGLLHCEAKNAPLSFVFGGTVLRGQSSAPCRYPGNTSLLPIETCKQIGNDMVRHAMFQRKIPRPLTERLIAQLDPLYDEVERAEIGQLIVLGVPQQSLHRYAYHCETGGIPTGMPIRHVLESLSSGIALKEGYQARFLFCRETMDRTSNIEVINLMNPQSVDAYLDTTERGETESFRVLYPEAQERTQARSNGHRELLPIIEKINIMIKEFQN